MVVPVIECPQLPPAPEAAVRALMAARSEPGVEDWVVSLERHYQKQESCD